MERKGKSGCHWLSLTREGEEKGGKSEIEQDRRREINNKRNNTVKGKEGWPE